MTGSPSCSCDGHTQVILVEAGDTLILNFGDKLDAAVGEERGEQLAARRDERTPGLTGRVVFANAVQVIVVRGGVPGASGLDSPGATGAG